jgi:hypothetical protein
MLNPAIAPRVLLTACVESSKWECRGALAFVPMLSIAVSKLNDKIVNFTHETKGQLRLKTAR